MVNQEQENPTHGAMIPHHQREKMSKAREANECGGNRTPAPGQDRHGPSNQLARPDGKGGVRDTGKESIEVGIREEKRTEQEMHRADPEPSIEEGSPSASGGEPRWPSA